MADAVPNTEAACGLCGKPAGDMAATVAYASIPVLTLCDTCAQAALGAWEVGLAVAGKIRDHVQMKRAEVKP